MLRIFAWGAALTIAATFPALSQIPGNFGTQRTLEVVRADAPPEIDGKLTDTCWETANSIGDFKQYGRTKLANLQTVGYVVFDDTNLYIGVRCNEPDPAHIGADVVERDGSVWDNDSVEIMIDPGASEQTYFQYIVNAAGSVFDAIRTGGGGGEQGSWNGEITAVGHIGGDYWSLEMRIPFYSLDLSADVGPKWGFNICRNKKTPNEMSSIAAGGAYNSADKFVALTGLNTDFSKLVIPVSRPQYTGEVGDDGLNASAFVRVSNETGKDRRLTIEYHGGELLRRETTTVATGAATVLDLGSVRLQPTPGRSDEYRLMQAAEIRRLIVSDADSGERLALSNLQYPGSWRLMNVRCAEPEPETDGQVIEVTAAFSREQLATGRLDIVVKLENTNVVVASRTVTTPARTNRVTFDNPPLPTRRLTVVAEFRTATDNSGAAIEDRKPLASSTRSFANVIARHKVGKVLNNLVTELDLVTIDDHELENRRQTTVEFINPRDGWIFIASVNADEATLQFHKTPGPAITVHGPDVAPAQEAMRWLPVGKHRLSISKTGSAPLEKLVVRAIPELAYWRYPVGSPVLHPLNEWDVLRDQVLVHMNVLGCSRAATLEPENQPRFERWRQIGKQTITALTIPKPGWGEERIYNDAVNYVAYTNPRLDGLIIDEVGMGIIPLEDFIDYTDAVRRLSANHPDKRYDIWALDIYGVEEMRPFLEAVIDNRNLIYWEWYEREEPDVASAADKLATTVTRGMRNWRDYMWDVAPNLGICLGYFAAPPESLNENPAVDMKVWIDMQMQCIATDPAFDGVNGLMEYNAKRADEELVRWSAELFRHYGIEGKRELLSEQYSYSYALTHIKNPDFDDGTDGWQIAAAAPDSIEPGSITGYGRLEGRVRGSSRGDNFLRMKRQAAHPNRISQTITGLEPGALYSIKMITADYQDLVAGRSRKYQHAVSIDIKNTETIKNIQQVFESSRGQEVPPFSSENHPWLNYHWRVFRAGAATADLTIADWAAPAAAGGPAGQELVFNFIEVQPYHESGNPTH